MATMAPTWPMLDLHTRPASDCRTTNKKEIRGKKSSKIEKARGHFPSREHDGKWSLTLDSPAESSSSSSDVWLLCFQGNTLHWRHGKSGCHGNRGLEVADVDDVMVVLKGWGQLEDVLWLVGLKVVGRVETGKKKSPSLMIRVVLIFYTRRTFWTHRSLEELTGGLLTVFSWNRTLPVDLSDEVVEDLRTEKHLSRPEDSGGVLVPRVVRLSGNNKPKALAGTRVTSLTLILLLAEVSRKAQEFHWRARPMPDSLATTRSTSRSHLFPTRTMGTCSTGSTKSILSTGHRKQVALLTNVETKLTF